jgi:hypothetical protein
VTAANIHVDWKNVNGEQKITGNPDNTDWKIDTLMHNFLQSGKIIVPDGHREVSLLCYDLIHNQTYSIPERFWPLVKRSDFHLVT